MTHENGSELADEIEAVLKAEGILPMDPNLVPCTWCQLPCEPWRFLEGQVYTGTFCEECSEEYEMVDGFVADQSKAFVRAVRLKTGLHAVYVGESAPELWLVGPSKWSPFQFVPHLGISDSALIKRINTLLPFA